MGQDAFVDVAYRGLELGRRLKLSEVGPRTAYIEHGTPMPVGAGLVIRTDAGLTIPVVVIRVHEQVAGADMPPGMRVRTEALEGAESGWWRELVTREDPVIPEAEMMPQAPATVPPPKVPPPSPEPAKDIDEPSLPLQAHDTVVMQAVDPAAEESSGGNGAPQGDPATSSRTMVMSALEIKGITDNAAAPADESGSQEAVEDDSGSNGDELQNKARGRRRGRRRR
jgi:hypothetical protein